MKKIIFCAIFLLLYLASFADNFQLTYRDGANRYSASYSPYKIVDCKGQVVAQGYSDKYGRVIINLSKGSYTCEVVYRNATYRQSITIDGNSTLKEVLLH